MDNWTEIQKLIVQLGLTIFAGLLVLTIAIRSIDTFGARLQLSKLVLSPIRLILKWAGFLIILAACLHPFGVNIGTYIASVLGLVAIGFVAVWSVLSNVSCTFILILLKPFRVNDVIDLVGEDVRGRVVDLNLVFTTLKTEEGDEVKIPNNLFFQKILRKKDGQGSISLAEQIYEKKPAD